MKKGKGRGRPRRDPTTLRKDLHQMTLRLDAHTVDLLGCARLVLGKSRQEIAVAAIGSYLLGEAALSKADQARIRYHLKGVR
jgi:hypothetical protein